MSSYNVDESLKIIDDLLGVAGEVYEATMNDLVEVEQGVCPEEIEIAQTKFKEVVEKLRRRVSDLHYHIEYLEEKDCW